GQIRGEGIVAGRACVLAQRHRIVADTAGIPVRRAEARHRACAKRRSRGIPHHAHAGTRHRDRTAIEDAVGNHAIVVAEVVGTVGRHLHADARLALRTLFALETLFALGTGFALGAGFALGTGFTLRPGFTLG